MFNPPPGERRMKGDLLYLEANTLEGNAVHITACTQGFFVNKTDGMRFSANKSGQICHDLIALLKNCSAQFRKKYTQLLAPKVPRHPFEVCPVPETLTEWTKEGHSHSGNPNRSEDFLCTAYGADPRGLMRDWNEEYQSCRELPKASTQDRITRDRMLYKVYLDYVDAAQKGAQAVVNKSIPAINPMEEPRAHVFVYNNIFFSFAVDGRDLLKAYGGDKAAHASSNNELLGVQAYDQADIDGLCTLATVVISYAGQRLVAQSIIPGILHGEHVSTHLYGSVDYGANIQWDEAFHGPITLAGKALHLKEHLVKDETGKEVKLASPVEAKGIRGSDGRLYILDILRSTAIDANFEGAKDSVIKVLRPELVKAFVAHKRYELAKPLQEALDAKRKAKAEAKKAIEDKKKAEEGDKKEGEKQEGDKEGEKKVEESEEQEKIDMSQFEVYLNPNALTPYALSGPASEIEEDESLVREASKFLKETVIPKVAGDLKKMEGILQEGITLKHYLHVHGINMRYLGEIATLLAESTHVQCIVESEMIQRQAKHLFNACLREIEDGVVAPICAHIMNCIFGEVNSPLQPEGKKKRSKVVTTPQDEAGPEPKFLPTLTTKSLWSNIKEKVKEAYGYELKVDRQNLNKLPLLRGICTSVGLQVLRRDYDMKSSRPFNTEDMQDLFPVAKYHAPTSSEAKELHESGRICLKQGLVDLASPLLNDALSILYQVYGPMHRETARCYSSLALLNFQVQNVDESIALQEKSVVILERVMGLDHPETAHAYETLATLLQASGRHQPAAVAFKRCLGLGFVLHGDSNLSLAMLKLKASGLLHESHPDAQVSLLQQALDVKIKALGADHLQSINCQHAVAMAHAQRGMFRLAMEDEKKVLTALQGKYDEKDQRTQEAAAWHREFTKRVVEHDSVQKKKLTDAGMSPSETKEIMKGVQAEESKAALTKNQKRRNRKKKSGGKEAEGDVVENEESFTEVKNKNKKKNDLD